MALPDIIEDISMQDYVMVVKDNCIRRITYEDFMRDFLLGGYSICEAIFNCWESMGVFEDNIPDEDDDTPPVFQDVYINLANRTKNHALISDDFHANYYDAEDDKFKQIVITGGDLSGVTFKGQPVFVGLVIKVDEINEIEYDAKDTDSAYQQVIFIEVYDENNIKATTKTS